MTVESIAGYMSDPLHPGQLAVQDNLVCFFRTLHLCVSSLLRILLRSFLTLHL